MATTTQPRPGLQAYRESLSLAFSDLGCVLGEFDRPQADRVCGGRERRTCFGQVDGGERTLWECGTPAAADVSGRSHIARP